MFDLDTPAKVPDALLNSSQLLPFLFWQASHEYPVLPWEPSFTTSVQVVGSLT